MSYFFSKTLENLKDMFAKMAIEGLGTIHIYFRLDMDKIKMTIRHEKLGPTFSSSYHKIGNDLLWLILSLEIPYYSAMNSTGATEKNRHFGI